MKKCTFSRRLERSAAAAAAAFDSKRDDRRWMERASSLLDAAHMDMAWFDQLVLVITRVLRFVAVRCYVWSVILRCLYKE